MKGFQGFMLILQRWSSTLSQSRRSPQWWGSCKVWRFWATWIGPQKASTFLAQSLHRSVSCNRKRFFTSCCRSVVFLNMTDHEDNVKCSAVKSFFLHKDHWFSRSGQETFLQSFKMIYSNFEILWRIWQEIIRYFFWNECCRGKVINVLPLHACIAICDVLYGLPLFIQTVMLSMYNSHGWSSIGVVVVCFVYILFAF